MSKLVIAIDGPAGAGKTTVAKQVAKNLGLSFLDTGAMYRCVALMCMRKGVDSSQSERAAQLARNCLIQFLPGDPQQVLLNDEDVTEQIRIPEVGDFASAVSVHSPVRRQLVNQQRIIVDQGGVVLEGRDTTTMVAPDADVKVFLTAGIDVRAQRRFKELNEKGVGVELEPLTAQIAERDKRDSTRADSPLSVADDAVTINSDDMSVDEVVKEVERLALVAKNG